MEKVSILYVDDEYLNLMAFEALFRRNYSVYCASNAKEGFSYLKQYKIEYIFCDQSMPDMCGTDFFREVKKEFPNVHCCILSGYTNDEVIESEIANGTIDRAFEKPFSQHNLEKYIKLTHAENEQKNMQTT